MGGSRQRIELIANDYGERPSRFQKFPATGIEPVANRYLLSVNIYSLSLYHLSYARLVIEIVRQEYINGSILGVLITGDRKMRTLPKLIA
jgi:hypothetical protein